MATKSPQKKNNIAENGSAFVAGQAGAFAAINESSATNEMLAGMDLFRDAAIRLGNVDPAFKHGNLYEYIEASKFNSSAGQAGSSLRAQVTAAHGDPTGSVDIKILDGEKVVSEYQAKSSDSSTSLLRELSKSKYNDMEKLTHPEKVARVKELGEKLGERRAATGKEGAEEFQHTAANTKGELSVEGVGSGGTSYQETMYATNHPEMYARFLEAKVIGKEIGVSAGSAAMAGAVIGGGISLFQNSISVIKGEQEIDEALKEVGKATGKAAVRSGVTGGVGAVIRIGATKAGFSPLMKSNVATAVAASAIDIGGAVLNFVRGEASGQETVERIGQSGTSTMSSIYSGAIAGAAFGPIGAVVGSIGGYLIASNIYQSCIAIFQSARLAEEESIRLIEIYEASCKHLAEQRALFETHMNEVLKKKKKDFTQAISILDSSILGGDPRATSLALANISQVVGAKMNFTSFSDFDRVMLDHSIALEF